MGQEKREDTSQFIGDVFEPVQTNEVGDWGNSDGFSLWDAAAQDPENGLEDWEGRRETHDMFRDSYQ